MNERLKKSIRAREDRFITFAEQQIRKGIPYKQAVKTAPEFQTPDCETRYNQWLTDAMKVKKWTGLDAVREEIRKKRAAEDQAVVDDKFYKDNLFLLRSHVEAGHDFRESGLPEHMRKFYQRAQQINQSNGPPPTLLYAQ